MKEDYVGRSYNCTLCNIYISNESIGKTQLGLLSLPVLFIHSVISAPSFLTATVRLIFVEMKDKAAGDEGSPESM